MLKLTVVMFYNKDISLSMNTLMMLNTLLTRINYVAIINIPHPRYYPQNTQVSFMLLGCSIQIFGDEFLNIRMLLWVAALD